MIKSFYTIISTKVRGLETKYLFTFHIVSLDYHYFISIFEMEINCKLTERGRWYLIYSGLKLISFLGDFFKTKKNGSIKSFKDYEKFPLIYFGSAADNQDIDEQFLNISTLTSNSDDCHTRTKVFDSFTIAVTQFLKASRKMFRN